MTFAALMGLAVLLAACAPEAGGTPGATGPPRDTAPNVLIAQQPGEQVHETDKAIMDFSNTSEGYFCVKSKMGDKKVKVLVDVRGTQYQYTIHDDRDFITIPLSEGNGTYNVGVWENITADQYASVFSQELQVTLADEFRPFLYPSQFVDFKPESRCVQFGSDLVQGSITDVDTIAKIYDYVIHNVSYDYDKAVTVASGYLPEPDETLSSKKGICFDYAVLTASVLRSQRVPAKLVVGYAGSAYHAWLEVYSWETGKVIGQYAFDGNKWVQMDPTFDAASGGRQNLSSVIGNGTNYQPMLYY